MWYPQDKEELEKILESYLKKPDIKADNIHGIIVPHAGYEFSGAIAGKAFSLLKDIKVKKAVVVGPSHRYAFNRIKAIDKIQTLLGNIKIISNNYQKIDYEHSVDNQIPFLQKLGFKEVLPLVVGQITNNEAKEIAKELAKYKDYIFVISTDLSHFLPYDQAVEIDKKTIEIIENLDLDNSNKIDACGSFPLLIMMYLCKLKGWEPQLIEYKNSGDIIGDHSQVVGYASFWF